MKILYSVFFLFLFTLAVSGQASVNSSNAPDLVVVQKEWQEINQQNSQLDTDPFQPINETNQELRDREETLRQERRRARAGLPPEHRTVRVKPIEEIKKDSEPSTVYIYKVKIKNTGPKAIQELKWEYVFFDSDTKQEVGRRQFISKVDIPPGKTESIVIRSASPPTGTINVKQSGKKLRSQYSEQIVIESIEYADGSLWQAAK